ncbi:MAG: collagen-like protein, partial [Bacteroidia bacterium]|nr:collagen-like protein [Bacteroidia bacterium]
PQGEVGPAGADGAIGPQGEVGPAGADGAVGPQGPQGEIGPAGADGAIGPEGPEGPQGEVGPVGPEGPQGNGIVSAIDNGDGTFSLKFSDGTIYTTPDLTGPQGPKGDQGDVGPQGPAGDPASDDQTLESDGTPGSIAITGGNTITMNVDDGDADSTNEIQTLTLVGNDLKISGGNTIALTPLGVDTNLATNNLTQWPGNRVYNMNNQQLAFANGQVGIGSINGTAGAIANSTLQVHGSLSLPIRSSNSNTTLGPNDHTLINYLKEAIITIPLASTCIGRIYLIKNLGNGDCFLSEIFIDKGGDPENKIGRDKMFTFQSDGVNWQLIDTN